MRKIILSICCILSVVIYAQPGSLDNTFGTGGKVTTHFAGVSEGGMSVAIQTDNKIVVAGYTGIDPNYEFALGRYNVNGGLDNTFGSGGIVTTAIGSYRASGNSVVIQSDGKIVVAGTSLNGSTNDFALARYNSDGSLDTTFGSSGKITTSIGGYDDEAASIALQGDGKIVVVGKSSNGMKNNFSLVRYNTDGTLDSTFGLGGKVITGFAGYDYDWAASIAIQADGKIVISGASSNTFAVIRFNGNGSLDTTFGIGGIASANFGNDESTGRSIVIQADGKIVVGGNTWDGMNTDFALARYNGNGTLDSTFNSDGKVTMDLGNISTGGYSVAMQNNGQIVLAGYIYNNSYDFALVRYNSNGNLDSAFGSGGIVSTDFGSVWDRSYSATIQSDGKIVLVGHNDNGSNYDFVLARYNNDNMLITQEIIEKKDVNIYPNPSSGIFYVNLHHFAQTKIYVRDMLGNCLLTKECGQEVSPRIDLSNLSKGIYFLEILSDGEKVVKKIVLE